SVHTIGATNKVAAARPSASGSTTGAWPAARASRLSRMSGRATAPFQPASDGRLSPAYVTNPSFATSRTTAMASAWASFPRKAIRADQKSASGRALIGLCDRRRFGVDPKLEHVAGGRHDPEARVLELRDGSREFVDRHRMPQS